MGELLKRSDGSASSSDDDWRPNCLQSGCEPSSEESGILAMPRGALSKPLMRTMVNTLPPGKRELEIVDLKQMVHELSSSPDGDALSLWEPLVGGHGSLRQERMTEHLPC